MVSDDDHGDGTGAKRRPGRTVGDLVGGFVAGLYSVPEGIGYASLAGLGPMLGIYSGMIPVAVAAAATSSVLMMSTLTSAIALTVSDVLDQGGYQGPEATRAVFTMTLLAGLIMVALGALRMGRIVNFVSNAVMTGFVMGVAVLIMVGKLDEIVGYDPGGVSNKVVKAADVVVHPDHWDPTTALVGLVTIVAASALKAVPRLERYALVLVAVGGTALVRLLSIDTATIGDSATIASGLAALPVPTAAADLPDLSLVPGLLAGSLSIAIVALAQGAGIAPAFPNPDGTRSDPSRDFAGQGLGNVAGALFMSPPSGGSLSRTAVSADSGGTRRLAAVSAALTVLLIVLFAGPVVGHIPEAVIGGLLLVIGVELVVGRLADAVLAWRVGRLPRALLLVTLVLTLSVPLQWAVLTGTVLSLLAYVARSSASARMRTVRRDDEGWLLDDTVPEVLPHDEPLLLLYTGSNFFATVAPIVDHLPAPDPDHPGVLMVDLGELNHYSSTLLKQLARYVTTLLDAGSGLVLVGVTDHQRDVLRQTGIGQRIGDDNLLPRDPHIDVTIRGAMKRGNALLAELQR
ncbi:MAG: SulP family inorganic anion transporter [Acidimicrobiales bacterium]